MTDAGNEPDPRSLRALAHPLRWRLLDLLGAEGTVTVTRCALVLGQSTASCSYHLGILAKYGYIVPAGGEGREKPWRIADREGPLSLLPRGSSFEEGQASEAAFTSWLDYQTYQMKDFYLRHRELAPADWQQALRIASGASWLTPAQANEVGGRLIQILQEIGDREEAESRPPDARLVRLFLAMTLTPELPPAGPENQ
jgi:hypothetical protein